MPAFLADAIHEPPEANEGNEQGTGSGVQARQTRIMEEAFDTGGASLNASRMPPTVLAIGLRYRVGTSWRGVLYGSLTALVILDAWRIYRGPRPDIAAYFLVTSGCCLALVGRLQSILHQWMRTSIEQSLLRLTPRWPEDRAVKRAVLQSLLMVQRGGVVAWGLVSLFAFVADWIGLSELLIGGIGLLATSLAFTGSVIATLTRRRVRELQLSTVALILTVAIGAIIVLFGEALGSSHVAIGLLLMGGPPMLCLAWYLLAPLRLPLNVDVRALKTPL